MGRPTRTYLRTSGIPLSPGPERGRNILPLSNDLHLYDRAAEIRDAYTSSGSIAYGNLLIPWGGENSYKVIWISAVKTRKSFSTDYRTPRL